MDALLQPNRALTRKAFQVLILGFVALNLILAMLFVAYGAYPVLAFLGLDIALLWLAFRTNFRDGGLIERVQVAADRIHVMRQPVKGAAENWIVSPHWARVRAEPEAVRIAAGDRSVAVGAFLSPPERDAFAAALEAAIAAAKRDRGDQIPSTSAMP